jgi:hypothetical protein
MSDEGEEKKAEKVPREEKKNGRDDIFMIA